jgi:hypothetical protein
MPDIEQVYVLIRSAVLTLNNAVRAGNFSVLRDGAAPSFQAANTSARLAHIFRKLDREGADLSRVAITAPTISRLKLTHQRSRLRVTGNFPGARSRIDFDLIFEMSRGRWRLFGISVNPARVVSPGGPGTVRARPVRTPPTKLPRYAPDWDVVSNRR